MNRWPGNYEGVVQLPRLGKSGPTAGGAGSVQVPQGSVPGIVGYFDGMVVNPFPSPTDQPIWDGKFSVVTNFDNFYDGFVGQGSHQIDGGSVCTCQLFLQGDHWRMRIGSDNNFGAMWTGTCPTLTGVYTLDGGQDDSPLTLTIAMLPGTVLHDDRISCAS